MKFVHWISQRGRDAASNLDQGGCVLSEFFDVGVVVDASKHGAHGEALARELVGVLLAAAQDVCPPDPVKVIEALRVFHAQSRLRFLQETASYALVVRSQAGVAWALVCGDCRVGLISAGCAINEVAWLSPVHTLANALGQRFDGHHDKLYQRHLLTRCWNTKRFHQPELFHFPHAGRTLCLATHGYWLEHCGLGVRWHALSDDASCLLLSPKNANSVATPVVMSDHDNFQWWQRD